MNNKLPQKTKTGGEDHWIGLSDVMTSLMMVFLLIAVIYMIKVKESVKVPQIYKQTTQGLGENLTKEFQSDLNKWGAVIDKDLTVRFQQPDILFATGSAVLTEEFKSILDDFFPRYLKIMMSKDFINNIEEIRIEGHTSSIWLDGTPRDVAYMNNMKLSQERTRATLDYILNSQKSQLNVEQKVWLMKYFRAIGFSSAVTLNKNGEHVQDSQDEDFKLSQRVEFRVRTNIEKRVSDIVEGK